MLSGCDQSINNSGLSEPNLTGMSLEVLRWLVVCVVLYAALVMLKEAVTGRRSTTATAAV